MSKSIRKYSDSSSSQTFYVLTNFLIIRHYSIAKITAENRYNTTKRDQNDSAIGHVDSRSAFERHNEEYIIKFK